MKKDASISDKVKKALEESEKKKVIPFALNADPTLKKKSEISFNEEEQQAVMKMLHPVDALNVPAVNNLVSGQGAGKTPQ